MGCGYLGYSCGPAYCQKYSRLTPFIDILKKKHLCYNKSVKIMLRIFFYYFSRYYVTVLKFYYRTKESNLIRYLILFCVNNFRSKAAIHIELVFLYCL